MQRLGPSAGGHREPSPRAAAALTSCGSNGWQDAALRGLRGARLFDEEGLLAHTQAKHGKAAGATLMQQRAGCPLPPVPALASACRHRRAAAAECCMCTTTQHVGRHVWLLG